MMAEELDDGEFWLPPKFLSDDDLLMEFGNEKSGGFGLTRPNSDLSSPGESVMGSTETESDEDEYLFGLSRRLAKTSLNDDLWKVEPNNKWSSTMATSPQSTLCNVMGGGCACSSRGSPNCTSPPLSKAVNQSDTAWSLLYEAAGEVEKMRRFDEAAAKARAAHFGAARKPNQGFVQGKNMYASQSYQLQANQQMKQQQAMKQQQQANNLRWGQQQQMGYQNRGRTVNNGRPLGLSQSAWPTLQQSQQPQQQAGSGMRAVFLGNPGAKRECSGTGVFLPRRVGTATETLKRPACSTVLLPDRVVQALNLNLKAMDASAAQLHNRSNSNNASYEAAIKYRNSVLMAEAQAQQRRNAAAIRPQPMAAASNEVRLPQEWTY
ncbi:uncharacterized protein LOC108199920 isoform X2 [Daucus carota subsp. sativus]|uniref:uncharacterized protein LOC108199920 isoform X2 n=1 Tax=Daucus carota subsp. sativus TaxID=79200 RepID=UPI0007EF36DF|nr:PREDICTED: uncharacterized protein LOC108199920 isoform X2 [Daucus carota subsp. sativus]